MSKENEPNIGLEDLDNAPDAVSTHPQQFTYEQFHDLMEKFSAVSQEKFELMEENSELRRKINTSAVLDELIKPYARRAFIFMCTYCFAIALFLIMDAFRICGFNLEPGIMEILVGSTAVTVIGLVGMVLTGIFVGARKG